MDSSTNGSRVPVFVTGTGQILRNVHKQTRACRKYGCSIHSPSDHHMKDWPTHYRNDRRLMERICPCGVGHPDPDHIGYTRRTYGEKTAQNELVHGCCQCCHCDPDRPTAPFLTDSVD